MRALLAAAFLGATLVSSVAAASPSRWARVADPELHKAEVVAAEAERDLWRADSPRTAVEDALTPSSAYAMKARIGLMEAGALRSRFPWLRLLLARAEQHLHHFTEATLLYESVVDDPKVPERYRADAWAELGIAYARLRRVPEEIEAEENAIAFEPLVPQRAIIIANQAEAFMGIGDISRAISGYRAALEGLSNFELARVGPTTLYSLGVSLDRAGDLEGGLQAIGRARSYDPVDRFLQGDAWFFSTPHDQHWYEALGHWLVGRKGDGDDVRLGAYERAVAAWKLYVTRAPADDPYVAVAKARLKQCEKELATFSRKVSKPTPIDEDPEGVGLPRTRAPRR